MTEGQKQSKSLFAVSNSEQTLFLLLSFSNCSLLLATNIPKAHVWNKSAYFRKYLYKIFVLQFFNFFCLYVSNFHGMIIIRVQIKPSNVESSLRSLVLNIFTNLVLRFSLKS